MTFLAGDRLTRLSGPKLTATAVFVVSGVALLALGALL
jgi:hypothetical protein